MMDESAARAERDRKFTQQDGEGDNPDRMADKNMAKALFGYDVEQDALDRWEELWRNL